MAVNGTAAERRAATFVRSLSRLEQEAFFDVLSTWRRDCAWAVAEYRALLQREEAEELLEHARTTLMAIAAAAYKLAMRPSKRTRDAYEQERYTLTLLFGLGRGQVIVDCGGFLQAQLKPPTASEQVKGALLAAASKWRNCATKAAELARVEGYTARQGKERDDRIAWLKLTGESVNAARPGAPRNVALCVLAQRMIDLDLGAAAVVRRLIAAGVSPPPQRRGQNDGINDIDRWKRVIDSEIKRARRRK
jgi:hypothetical protein